MVELPVYTVQELAHALKGIGGRANLAGSDDDHLPSASRLSFQDSLDRKQLFVTEDTERDLVVSTGE